jgi:multidrug efflux pump subunit AcrB
MITAFALKNSRTVVYSMVLVVLAGALLMIKQPRLEDPFIVIREALITTKFPGMAPERVERLITRVMRNRLAP